MKTKIIIINAFLLLIMLCFSLYRQLNRVKQDYQRIEASFKASEKALDHYKLENGALAARLDIMELNASELRHIFPRILQEIKKLDIKPQRARQYTETVITQEKQIIKQLKDSIIYDTIVAKSFDYRDAYYKISGQIWRDTLSMDIASCDSIIQVVYKGKRKRPWLWIFSPRRLQQVIHSKNPHSTIQYSKTIQITQ